ncbi:hypothetical protein ACWD1Z_36645 [Streptomyces sp. NPDC002784]
MSDKVKLQVFFVVSLLISIAALVAGVATGDGMYLFLGGMGLLGLSLLSFAAIRRRKGSA